MSTQSRIAIKKSDGSFEAVTCHYDGYPKHIGRILLEKYKTQVDVEDLISNGHLIKFTRLGNPSHIQKEDTEFIWKPNEIFPNYPMLLESKLETGYAQGVAYLYIFDDGRWYGYYPYCSMNPMLLEYFEAFIKKRINEELD